MAHLLLPLAAMRGVIVLLLCLQLCGFSQAAQLPLTPKEVSLMLRSGYSSTSIIQELGKRRFAGVIDADLESTLLKAGATQALLEALKRGDYAVSEKEAAHVQEQLARQSIRTSLAADRAKKEAAALPITKMQSGATATASAVGGSAIYEAVKGDIVRVDNGAVVHSDDEALAGKKLIALYFSGHWCPPCRKFTPELVEFYNRVAPQHPEFEILFVSVDHSDFAMQSYMREANMPWPAIDYSKIAAKESITRYVGKGVPCLVLVDAAGKVLSDSFVDTNYVGPQKVVADIESILSGAGAGHVAQVH
jgi:nucleoredoxin